LIFAFLVLGLAGVIGVGGGLYWSLHHPQSDSRQVVAVHVRSGDSAATIAERLNARGVINNPLLFRIDARLQNLADKLMVGDYSVRRNMSIHQMVAALTIYHQRRIRITIPEGQRKEQIARILLKSGIDGKKFLREVSRPDLRSRPELNLSIVRNKPAAAGLEGYLFPETYDVPPHYSPRKFLALMLKTLDERFTPAMRAKARRQGLSVFKVLTLASIVEREARIAAERPIIASVYLNRLRLRTPMPLQADPTVQYALGTSRNWWPVLTREQLQSPSPYNTYLNRGLPPGPIANPGLASIKAVVSPKSTHFYFFVARGHGHHAFARTYEEQLANEAKYGP
jgi:UPF0755 protein